MDGWMDEWMGGWVDERMNDNEYQKGTKIEMEKNRIDV